MKYVWLVLWGQIYALGIAATLNIEDATSCPAMLIVAYQLPIATGVG